MHRARAASVLALCAAVACKTPGAGPDAPARIVDPTPASRKALAEALKAALNGAPVVLADDALTESSALIIEHVTPRDLSGRQLDGRELGRPLRFRLVSSASLCVLVRESDGARWVLHDTSCIPE